jgi:GMP synthase-like glutamine amidotransferase
MSSKLSVMWARYPGGNQRKALRIATLETGYPPEHLVPQHGTYPDMLARFLGPEFEVEVFDVQKGPPPAPDAFAAVAVMGSPSGVYDGDPWIARLLDWIRDAKGRTKLLGVCFGHQAIAQAWGGEVRKAPAGWGLGLHQYDVHSAEPWMGSVQERIAIPVSHQDQVLTAPPSARVVARSAFTPYAILAYDEDALSFQCHPSSPSPTPRRWWNGDVAR